MAERALKEWGALLAGVQAESQRHRLGGTALADLLLSSTHALTLDQPAPAPAPDSAADVLSSQDQVIKLESGPLSAAYSEQTTRFDEACAPDCYP